MRVFRSLGVLAARTVSLQTISVFHYRSSAPLSKQQKSKNVSSARGGIQFHELENYQHKTIDAAYWEGVITQVEPLAAKVIKACINPNTSKKQITRELVEYLQFRTHTFDEGVRSYYGCLAVLVALNQHDRISNFEEYENRITDFVTLSDIKSHNFDGFMLRYLILALNKRIYSVVNKNLRQYYRMKLVEIMIDNIQQIDSRDILLLIKVIEESIQKDTLNFITKWRFYPLVQAIFNRILVQMKIYIQTQSYQTKSIIQTELTNPLYHKMTKLIFNYGFTDPETALTLCKYIICRVKKENFDHNAIYCLLNTITYIPHIDIKGSDGEITSPRKILAKFLIDSISTSYAFKSLWGTFNTMTKRFMLQRFFEDEFHNCFKALPFQNYHDKYLLLKKQHLKVPDIPEIAWNFFKEDQVSMLSKNILRSTITRFYRDRISIPEKNWPSPNFRKSHWAAQNEVNLKVWEALEKLGYKFEKQQICADRQVDIVIDGNIAIELDGEGHFNPLSSELESDTTYRNLQLLLSGYKLIVISMFEYNENRDLQDLMKLIKEKINLIEKEGYVYVC